VVEAVLDTAAYRIWMDQETFRGAQGNGFSTASDGARGIDGTQLDVVGQGMLNFERVGL
jgi:hypothetical protein